MKQRTPMKRRPLPSDPVTGEPPETPPAHPISAPPATTSPAPAPLRASPAPDQYQTTPRQHAKYASHSGVISNQTLQSVEYQTTPAARHHYPDQYTPSPQAHHQTAPRIDPSRQAHRQLDTYDSPSRHDDDLHFGTSGPAPSYQQPDARGQARPEHYDLHIREDFRQLPPAIEDRPPPPPAHRSRHNSLQEVAHRSSFDISAQKPTQVVSMRYDVLKSEAHRHSTSSHPGRPVFRGYDSAPPVVAASAHNGTGYEPSRHHSYDAAYDPHYRNLQPTVEDVPDSPGDVCSYSDPYRQSGSRRYHRDETGYDQATSPGPLALSRSPGASPLHTAPSPTLTRDAYEGHGGYQAPVSPVAPRGYSTSPGNGPYDHPLHSRSNQSIHQDAHGPYDHPQHSRSNQSIRQDEWDLYTHSSSKYGVAELPPSLIPGHDSRLSQQMSERVHEERRHERRYTTQGVVSQTIRGRHMIEPPPSYGPGQSASPHGHAQQYEMRSDSITYSGGPEPRMIRNASPNPQARNPSPNPYARDPSPNPQHTIRRKSVSPAPPPVESRRLSGVPFNPDSYDAYNSSMPATREERAATDPDAKIITYDGKEIDPSDHLPIESWAPEPDAKKQPSPEPRSRQSLSGAQPMPPSGRRQLRVAVRTQPPPPAAHPSYGPQEPLTALAPVSAGRNRLQKKANRGERHSLAGPTPLASMPPEKYHDRQASYSPTRGPGNSHWDNYASELKHPQGSGPSIPSKLPLAIMSGANGGNDQMALMQEMQRIDIGAGRSRRRGGY